MYNNNNNNDKIITKRGRDIWLNNYYYDNNFKHRIIFVIQKVDGNRDGGTYVYIRG